MLELWGSRLTEGKETLHRSACAQRRGGAAACGALLGRLSFSFHQHHFQRMMSLDNDSIIHSSYSSIPADPSLTVLKLSIKQCTGGKKGTRSKMGSVRNLTPGFAGFSQTVMGTSLPRQCPLCLSSSRAQGRRSHGGFRQQH
ncbi:hypothetical protein AAY473_015096 [Plecturocebus cupreus]